LSAIDNLVYTAGNTAATPLNNAQPCRLFYTYHSGYSADTGGLNTMTQQKSSGEKGQFLVYEAEDGRIKIDVRLEDETVWLTQQHMAELFQTTKQNIGQHLKNTSEERELEPDSVVKKIFTTAADGKQYSTNFYNLDAIISVGYRVKSHVATRFRIWATQHLKEYIIKGFVLDDERLKNPDQPFDYFEELTRRIQDIRTSERRFYQKITDIYATSIDYDPTQEISIEFFKTVQNKMHWAITGKTAAEIIHERADANKPNMGLTSWRGAKVRKQDVGIAKNYLAEEELKALNNLVEQYLIFAEGQAMRRIPMYMRDWIGKLDAFMDLNERDILTHAGKISHEIAMTLAEQEYDKFQLKRIQEFSRAETDFDKAVKQLSAKPPRKKSRTSGTVEKKAKPAGPKKKPGKPGN
jgi:hypothetical protein